MICLVVSHLLGATRGFGLGFVCHSLGEFGSQLGYGEFFGMRKKELCQHILQHENCGSCGGSSSFLERSWQVSVGGCRSEVH